MQYNELPSREYLSERWSYTADDGKLINRPRIGSDKETLRFNTRYSGKEAGGLMGKTKYRYVKIEGKFFACHRVIWKMMTGNDPSDSQIDHKDRNKLNNRWNNLRLATPSQNNYNMAPPRTNTSGQKGVTYNTHDRKWKAQLGIRGYNQIYLGYFNTKEEAIAAYNIASKDIQGEYAFNVGL